MNICENCLEEYGIKTLPDGRMQTPGNYARSRYCSDTCMQIASNRKRTAYLEEKARLKEYYRERLAKAQKQFIYTVPA